MVVLNTHYEVLGLTRQATAEEVKGAYQKLVLTAHPDKAGDSHTERFHELQQAWQVLRDPKSRALYDHQLSQAELKATVVLHDEIELDDMDEHHGGGPQQAGLEQRSQHQQEQQQEAVEAPGGAVLVCHTYPCRCGDAYVLTAADAALAGISRQIIIPCRSCSNHILVKLPP